MKTVIFKKEIQTFPLQQLQFSLISWKPENVQCPLVKQYPNDPTVYLGSSHYVDAIYLGPILI